MEIRPGLRGSAELVVGGEHTAPSIGSGKVRVLATPVGMRVRAAAEVVSVDGRTIRFRVEARDDVELIGDGTHERVSVNVAKFDQRIQRKLKPIA